MNIGAGAELPDRGTAAAVAAVQGTGKRNFVRRIHYSTTDEKGPASSSEGKEFPFLYFLMFSSRIDVRFTYCM